MIIRTREYSRYENRRVAESHLTLKQKIAIFDELWEEARRLGKLRKPGSLEGIEDKIAFAKVLNSCSKRKPQR